MDFLDPQKQRKHAIQLMIGYVLMAIVILLATTILVYLAYGFGVTKNGEVVQKGLVFVSSQPSNAQVYVDNKLKDTTNTKLTLPTGRYTLTFKREGYNDWSRKLSVSGSMVDHVVYPLLFPTNLTSTAIKTYDIAPILSTQSPDRRWLLVQPSGADGTFEVFDLNKKPDAVAEVAAVSVPVGLLSESVAPASWKELEWSTNNRHVLFERTFVAKDKTPHSEFILLDRQRPEGSHNLSQELGVTPTTITLRDKKPDSYYLFDKASGVLSTASLDSPSPVETIKGVLEYKTHGANRVLYATATDAPEGQVKIMLREGDITYKIRTVEASNKYLLNIAQYDGNWYVVLGSQSEDKVYIYRNPVQKIKVSRDKEASALFALRLTAPTSVTFSANTQFIAASNGRAIRIYDAEHATSYSYDAPYPLDTPQERGEWMDGSHLTYVSGGAQVIFDYDSTNGRKFNAATALLPSAFDQQYQYLYSFNVGDANQPVTTLISTPLRTPSDL